MNTNVNGQPDRFARQRGLLPQEQLVETGVSIIGVGAIGRQVALQVAALGVGKIQLVDFDKVTVSNVSSQGYLQTDALLQRPKVQATREAIWRIDRSIEVDAIEDRYRPKLRLHDVVFCCVDTISTRAAIWRHEKQRCRFWADGRMLGEVVQVLVVAGGEGFDGYQSSLFPQAEAQVGSCTSRSTLYAASIAAGLMVHQLTRWRRGMPVDNDTSLNLLAGEWMVAEALSV